MVEFINLDQGGMSVQDYSPMVANRIEEMNKFVMGFSTFVEKECPTEMLVNDIDISRLMVYARKIGESKLER